MSKIIYDLASLPHNNSVSHAIYLFNDFNILLYNSKLGKQPIILHKGDDNLDEVLMFDLSIPEQLLEYNKIRDKILHEKSESKNNNKESSS